MEGSKHGFPVYVPVLSYCCFFIPIKTASWIIALLGIIPTVVCFILSTPLGNDFLRVYGLPASYSPLIEWIYCVLGIEVGVSSIILLVGAIEEMLQIYYVIYLWMLPVYTAGSFATAIFIAKEAAKSKYVKFGVTYLLLGMVQVVIAIYFWIVIKSRLFVKKADNNVVNINITII